eukprot:gene59857-81885_t
MTAFLPPVSRGYASKYENASIRRMLDTGLTTSAIGLKPLSNHGISQHAAAGSGRAWKGERMTYDAVVIGAGHNGLAAAVELARKGWSVAVVEASSAAGGAMRTAEVTLPGFRHDLCAMNLSMFAGSAFFNDNKDALL